MLAIHNLKSKIRRTGDELMPKRTYQPKKVPRKRTHGFLVRMRTRSGRAVIAARRRRNRQRLTIADA